MPAPVQFYQLLISPLERALPRLLEKAYGSGMKTLVVAESDEVAERLNQLLWTYDPNSFLPHGTVKDGHNEHQPVLLAPSCETECDAKLLVVTDGKMPQQADRFERILDIFDGNNEESLSRARQRWTLYKNAGHPCTYLKQTEAGGWEQKAAA